MKTLKTQFDLYRPKAKDEQDFVDKHVVDKIKDRNGNGADVFQGNTKPVDRKKTRLGYNPGEDQTVNEGTMRLSKVHIIHHHDHPEAKEFAKNYVAGKIGDHREGGPTEKDEKAADAFHTRYSYRHTRHGFAGSGTTIYHDRKTGAEWKVDRHPNGKTFYGTDHIISPHVPMHEEVELEEAKVDSSHTFQHGDVVNVHYRDISGKTFHGKANVDKATSSFVHLKHPKIDEVLKFHNGVNGKGGNQVGTVPGSRAGGYVISKAMNEDLEEGVSRSLSSAINKAEASRQRAIKRAAQQVKRGGSIENAIRDHDLFPKDADAIRKHAGMHEEVEDLDEEKEVPLAHRHKYDISHYRVLNNGKDVTRHDSYEDAKNYAAKHRADLKKKGYKSNEVTVHAYVKEEVEDLDEAAVKISHDRYLRSHGKKAGGAAEGMWVFTHKKSGKINLNDKKHAHIASGKFADASKAAKKWAMKHGHDVVYVAEDFADDLLRDAIFEMAELEGADLTEVNVDALVEEMLEAVKNPYAVGMAAAEKATGDTPPLKKSTIKKGHEIAKKVMAKEEVDLDEDRTYIATSEKSKFGKGHRAKLLNPEGKLVFLSQKAYKTPEHAMDAAEYHHSLRMLPLRTMDDKMSQYDRKYDAKHSIKEDTDNEGGMALDQLSTAERSVKALMPKIKDDTQLPAWVQAKLTQASSMLNAVANYMSGPSQKKIGEEVEDLEELSKGTLASYINKAIPTIHNKAYNAGKTEGSGKGYDVKNIVGSVMRQHSVDKALKKLTKEDVINRTIEKYVVSESELPTPTERLIAKLDGLSESHIHTLLSLFESLNEDNQTKMLSAAETQEGIKGLLDFAINSRGA